MRAAVERLGVPPRHLCPVSSSAGSVPARPRLRKARQTGKTTLARVVYPELRYVDLDAPEQREALRAVRADQHAGFKLKD